MCVQELIEKIHANADHAVWVSSCSCFLCSFASRAELFFGLHLPAWPLDSCSVCQLVVSGTLRREEFAGKRGRGPAGALQPHQVLLSVPTVLQHSKEKGFPCLLSCSFCSACGGRNVGGKCALFTMHWSACRLYMFFYLLSDLY